MRTATRKDCLAGPVNTQRLFLCASEAPSEAPGQNQTRRSPFTATNVPHFSLGFSIARPVHWWQKSRKLAHTFRASIVVLEQALNARGFSTKLVMKSHSSGKFFGKFVHPGDGPYVVEGHKQSDYTANLIVVNAPCILTARRAAHMLIEALVLYSHTLALPQKIGRKGCVRHERPGVRGRHERHVELCAPEAIKPELFRHGEFYPKTRFHSGARSAARIKKGLSQQSRALYVLGLGKKHLEIGYGTKRRELFGNRPRTRVCRIARVATAKLHDEFDQASESFDLVKLSFTNETLIGCCNSGARKRNAVHKHMAAIEGLASFASGQRTPCSERRGLADGPT